MFDKAMKIFESEFEFKAFMLQIANDYEKKYYLKNISCNIEILNETQKNKI